MIKQDFHISNIIARHLSGEITPEENAQLEKWRKADSAHEALFQKICSKENLKKHVEKRSLTRSSQEEPEISRCVMQILPRQQECLAGRLKKGWMRCVPIHGDGSHRIQTDMKNRNF